MVFGKAGDRLRFGLKLFLLSGCFFLQWSCIQLRLNDLETVQKQLGYIALYCLLAACLVCSAFVRNAPLRLAYATSFAVSAYVSGVYTAATDQFLTLDAFENLLASRAFLGDAFKHDWQAFVSPAPFVLILLGATVTPIRFSLRRSLHVVIVMTQRNLHRLGC